MSREKFKRAEELFLEATELEPDKRQIFLDQACEGDAALRREVDALLAHDQAPHHNCNDSRSLPLGHT
jgi:serine/threonine-protein kinase